MIRLALTLLSLTLAANAAPGQGDKKIAWYGTWELAKAEAKRLNRPILLVSAAPHCHNVSGLW